MLLIVIALRESSNNYCPFRSFSYLTKTALLVCFYTIQTSKIKVTLASQNHTSNHKIRLFFWLSTMPRTSNIEPSQ